MHFQAISRLVLLLMLTIVNVCRAEEFALFVDDQSNVGVGTDSPIARLHVLDDVDAKLQIENTGSVLGTRVMFNLVNGGGIRFDMFDKSTGSNWVFQNQAGTFDVTLAGTGTREFRFYPNGNLEISGALISASSREIKNNILPVDRQSVLDRVIALPINSWSYKKEQGVTHIGPMAEDFYRSFGLGSTKKGIAAVDTGGVALAAIQGMKEENDTEIALLKAENVALQSELAQLRSAQDRHYERTLQLEMALAEISRNQHSGGQVSWAN